MPWTVVDGPEGALAFADRLGGAPPWRAYYTSVSAPIDYGIGLFAQSGVEAARQVIDVSGDGLNNDGRLVTPARDAAVKKGIVVNGRSPTRPVSSTPSRPRLARTAPSVSGYAGNIRGTEEG